MSTPKPPTERQPTAAAGPPPSPAKAADTKRPTDSVPMQAGSFAKLPLRFGRYQVEKLLGKGAMGAVYLARDTQLDRLVALKIPKLSASAKGSEKLLKRLKTEAMAAAQIDHPCVCPVHDSGDIDGIPYIAMQYIEGETLKDHLQNHAKTPQEAVALILQLAEGLAEAHSRKIYHRDLKPENIKLNRRGVAVIMDFGLAKLATTIHTDASATQAGTTLGTPAYMSPEQANGQVAQIDHRSDLYALGVILYEMLTGTWPFLGTAVQVMALKTLQDPPSPLTVKPEVDPQLAAVCHKMIARERQNRCQTAQEVIAALKPIEACSKSATGSATLGTVSASAVSDIPAFESAEEGLASIIARKRQEAAAPTTPAHRMRTMLGALVRSVKSVAGRRSDKAPRPKAKKSPAAPVVWIGTLAGLLLAGILVLYAGGLFKLKTREGILVLDVNEPGAEVFVDGEQVTVTWAHGQKKATVGVKPGERRVEVKKDGFEVAGKKLQFKEGVRTVFDARLRPVQAQSEPVLQANELPVGKPIDLLEMVQLPDHVVQGKWKRLNGAISCESFWGSRFMAPVSLTGDLQLTCKFARRTGNDGVIVVFPVGETQCAIIVDAMAGTLCGVAEIKHLYLDKLVGTPAAIRKAGPIANGVSHTLDIAVAHASPNVAIQASLDDASLISWTGSIADLSNAAHFSTPHSRAIGVVVWNSITDIHELKIELKQGGRGYLLSDDWMSPLSEVMDNPTPDVAKQCLTWNGRKYFISERPLFLPDAQSLATQLKGRLLTISSAEEEEFILAQGRGLALWMAGWQPPEMDWRDERNRPLRFIGTLQPRTAPIQVAANLTIFTAGDRRGWNALPPLGKNICHACIEWGEEYSSDLTTKTQELKPPGPQ